VRRDEEFAKDVMFAELSRYHSIGVEPGDEPPDYYFIIDGTRYAVDVTWLMEERLVNGSKLSRRGEEIGFRRWLGRVESHLKDTGLLCGTFLTIKCREFLKINSRTNFQLHTFPPRN